MKLTSALFAGAAALFTSTGQAQDFLVGDTRLACEAVMCLSSGQRPQECKPSLQRYFGIRHRKPGDMLRARVNFLKLCPASNQSAQMASLVSAVATGAGSCDAPFLNLALQYFQDLGNGSTKVLVSNQLPASCRDYLGNAYVDQSSLAVRYVGTPDRNGYWVASAQWEVAQGQWFDRTAAEDIAVKSQAAASLGLRLPFSN